MLYWENGQICDIFLAVYDKSIDAGFENSAIISSWQLVIVDHGKSPIGEGTADVVYPVGA